MSSARDRVGWLRFYPNTALGIVFAAVFVFFVGPVRTIFDVHFPPHGLREYALTAYVGLIFLAYVAAVLVVTEIDLPGSWAGERRLESLASAPFLRLRRWTAGQRRAAAVVVLAVGAGLLAWGPRGNWAASIQWGVLGVVTAAWLGFGRFAGDSGDRGVRVSQKAGIVLVLLLGSSLVGEFLWWLIAQPWNPVTWRFYSLWAILQLMIAALGVAVLADTLGRSLEQRLGWGLLAITLLVLSSALPVRVGETREPGEIVPGAAASHWFDEVEARLAAIPPEEPVLFVAASGGGSRAAIHAIAVLEALERTPAHGPVGSWEAPEEKGESLADRVLFISSVSGGSVASAHYAFTAAPDQDVVLPRNTVDEELREEAAAEWERLCEHHREDRCQQEACRQCSVKEPACAEKECTERRCLVYARLCTAHDEGYRRERLAEELLWPIHSARIDAMATGFNAPLMRGMVSPGLERGVAMSRFWRRELNWSYQPVPTDSPAHVSRPLLLINLTDVESGTRLVAGFPQLPSGLLAPSPGAGPGGARALTDLHEDLSVEVEEAVRMSANFPWGFDLPVLLRKPQVLAIDGGVLDNTGIDTFVELLRRLERLADPASPSSVAESVQVRAGDLLLELARRGVVLLEIDSGAKPEKPGVIARVLQSLLMPVHALSMTSYVRSIEASGSQVRLMQETLRRAALRGVTEECDAQSSDPHLTSGVVQGERLSHVVYVLDTESLAKSWALASSEKGKLLARFLAEDAGQRLELRDEFLDLEGANVSRCEVLERSRERGYRNLACGLEQLDQERQRLENEEEASRGERRRSLYEGAGLQAESPRAPPDIPGWIYLGQYRRPTAPESGPGDAEAGWLTTKLGLSDRSRSPDSLVGARLETSDS
ncbi:MAG: hypothetical protein ACR2PQ_11275, partial [Myxococcota bacterium]